MKKASIGILILMTCGSLTGCESFSDWWNSLTFNSPPPRQYVYAQTRPITKAVDEPKHTNVATTLDQSGRDVPLNQHGEHYNQAPEHIMVQSSDQPQKESIPLKAEGGLMTASLGNMTETDRGKMSHALDGPPGKSTQWTNMMTGVSYTVTPVRKVVIDDNHLCREYSSVATKNGQKREVSGVACIADDGNWHTIKS